MDTLNVNMPKTLFALSASDVSTVGWFKAKPFYSVPASPHSTKATESEYAYSCAILRPCANMVVVRFDWSEAPGEREQVFHPHEIHVIGCMCRACKGDDLYLFANTTH